MDNFTAPQYERFEAYRRHALPKQAVRKVRNAHPVCPQTSSHCPQVVQQTLGQQVSQPVAQIVAGFGKVFVGEMVEKGTCARLPLFRLLKPALRIARAVQQRRGETGPLSPDHLREAYRIYQQETGRVGAARPLRSKKIFVR